VLGKACHARITLAIMADSSEIVPSLISEENIGAEVDGLSSSLEAPAGASKVSQIYRIVDRHKVAQSSETGPKCNPECIRRAPSRTHEGARYALDHVNAGGPP